MRKKWKNLQALCLAAMLGVMMPVSAMEAAEESAGTEQDALVAENQDNSIAVEQDVPILENQVDETDAVSEGITLDSEESPTESEELLEVSEENPELIKEITLYQEDNAAYELQTQQIALDSSDNSAPVLELNYQGQNLTQSLGGTIEYNIFIGNRDQRVSISATQGSHIASLSYYLDQTNGSDVSKSEEQLNSLWQTAEPLSYQEVPLNQDGKYVLYVKAVAENGQSVCVRTSGMVVDTVSPVITGVQANGTYPLGTKFGVEDDNLDTVLVNEQVAQPDGNGKYSVAANGTSCVIKAKDKAGHETTISITINGEGGNPGGDTPGGDNPGGDNPGGDNPGGDNPGGDNPGGDNPQGDISVINNSGKYSLKTGTAYRLGSGDWTLEGDSSVYSGGSTFYVNKNGDYNFTKR